MKLNKLETHDRYLEFNKQADYISQGCRDCIDNRPKEFEKYPFYIFAHKREIALDEKQSMFMEDMQRGLLDITHIRQYKTMADIPSAKLIWLPRLTKPVPQSNSMLFKYYPTLDQIKVIWMLPQKELWEQYKKGNMTESKIIVESINAFENNKKSLGSKESDDLPDDIVDSIYNQISVNASKPKLKL